LEKGGEIYIFNMTKFETSINPEVDKAKVGADKYLELKYLELKKRHPNNPLFKTEFSKDVPKDYVSVYHVTREKYIDDISRQGFKKIPKIIVGLRGFELTNELNWLLRQKKIYQIFDQYAPKGFSRKAIYASPVKYGEMSFTIMRGYPDPIIVEIKVDPKKVLVADAEIFNQAFRYLEDESKVDEKFVADQAKKFWSSALSLEDYKSKNKDHIFEIPEIIIPFKINEKFMKIVKE